VASAIGYTILIKRLSADYKPITILSWQYLYGSLLFAPLFFAFDFRHFIAVEPDLRLVSTLLMLVAFASLLAFFLFIKTVKKLGVNKTNVFTNFVPVVTAVTAWFILPEEHFSVKTIIGIVVVISGIYITQLKRERL